MSNMEFDRFGVVKKFPDLEGGITLLQGGPEWHEKDSEHGYKSIPGAKIQRKTFSFNKKLKPDQEVTIYVSLQNLNPEYGKGDISHCKSGSGHSIKLRGANHPKEDDNPKSAKCYIFHYEYEGSDCNNFQKEYPHPRYSKFTLKEENKTPNWIGKVMGFKAALLNTSDGKKVEFWSWYDPSAKIDENGNLVPGNNWLLRYHVTDEGQFASKKEGKKESPKTKKPFLECHGGYTEFRMDNAPKNTKAFCASLREIRRP